MSVGEMNIVCRKADLLGLLYTTKSNGINYAIKLDKLVGYKPDDFDSVMMTLRNEQLCGNVHKHK